MFGEGLDHTAALDVPEANCDAFVSFGFTQNFLEELANRRSITAAA